MPSILVPGAVNLTSGGVNILSGVIWSGRASQMPIGSIALRAGGQNSGYIYISLSGMVTINSGGLNTSGIPNMSGLLDGMQMAPGSTYNIPRSAFTLSGTPSITAVADTACSGQARLYIEGF